MFKFDIEEEVRIVNLSDFDPNIYKVGKIVKVRKRILQNHSTMNRYTGLVIKSI